MSMVSFDVEIEHWIQGAAEFKAVWPRRTKGKVERAMKAAYRISDERVHVITGYLKSTGQYSVDVIEDGEIEGVLEYTADYAGFEFGRGGEHDALTPAIVEVGDQFLDAMGEGYEETISSWK